MSNKLNKVRSEGLDKFYTIPLIAKKSIDKVGEIYDWNSWDLIIEPSAGNGSFFLNIPSDNKIGIDIEPEHKDITKGDFFDYIPPPLKKNILVIGNPPFGRVSSIAIKFFNHAAKFANVIAFIIPRTFRRISVQNKLNKNYHLYYDEDIPMKPCSFYPQMMAKCCFQIWIKDSKQRKIIKLKTEHPHWVFLPFGPKDSKGQPTPPDNADFAIRAYGGKCGYIVDKELNKLRPKSWHWIKAIINKDELLKRFSTLDYSLSLDTTRQNSIGKGELVKLYSDNYH